MRTNAQQQGAADGNIFTLEVFDKLKNLKYRERIAVANKVQGRMHASLNILTKIFGTDYKWLQLVNETKDRIEQARISRGAPERPVFKNQAEYLREFN